MVVVVVVVSLVQVHGMGGVVRPWVGWQSHSWSWQSPGQRSLGCRLVGTEDFLGAVERGAVQLVRQWQQVGAAPPLGVLLLLVRQGRQVGTAPPLGALLLLPLLLLLLLLLGRTMAHQG